jgi:hypothetical protein
LTGNKELQNKIKIRGKLVPEEIISMVHEAIDTINNFVSIVTRIYEKGADAGFSREEISQQIIRPIARQRGLNKDQVYYLSFQRYSTRLL